MRIRDKGDIEKLSDGAQGKKICDAFNSPQLAQLYDWLIKINRLEGPRSFFAKVGVADIAVEWLRLNLRKILTLS